MPPGRRAERSFFDTGFGDDAGEESTLTADLGIYLSFDGRRKEEEMLNVGHKKRRIVDPTNPEDSYGEWIPVPDQDCNMEDMVLDDVASVPDSRKRKEYASSVRTRNNRRFHADLDTRMTRCRCGGL